jgi:hypothetical protein
MTRQRCGITEKGAKSQDGQIIIKRLKSKEILGSHFVFHFEKMNVNTKKA